MNPHQRCIQAKVKYRNEPKTGNIYEMIADDQSKPRFWFHSVRDAFSTSRRPTYDVPWIFRLYENSGQITRLFPCVYMSVS